MENVMDKPDRPHKLKNMSPEERRTFEQWLYANAVISLMIAGGLIAMAVASFNPAGLRETTTAIKPPAIGVAAAQRREQGNIR